MVYRLVIPRCILSGNGGRIKETGGYFLQCVDQVLTKVLTPYFPVSGILTELGSLKFHGLGVPRAYLRRRLETQLQIMRMHGLLNFFMNTG
jgi:hypothetical protein